MTDFIIRLVEHEGFEGMPYRDSVGIWTIGVGTKLPINMEEALLLLSHRLNNTKKELAQQVSEYNVLPKEIQEVLLDMAYNLGVPKLLQFKHMLQAVKQRDWKQMVEEIKDSRYYYQVTHRAEDNINIIKSIIGT